MIEREIAKFFDFLAKHRLMLPKNQSINHLSAGLQPKITFVRDENVIEPYSDMITITSSGLSMGGPYLWKFKGTWKSPITGSRLPLYGDQKPIEMPNFNVLCPIQNKPNYKLALFEGFPTIAQKTSKGFDINEKLEEIVGNALFPHLINNYNVAKMQMWDVTGNGLLDVIFGTNDWSEYYPKKIINGKEVITRWGDENYQPFDNFGNWRGGRLHGEVYYLENISESSTKDFFSGEVEEIKFASLKKIKNVDQYGFCTPVLADFTGNGLEDMICGDFLHSLTFFKRLEDKMLSDGTTQVRFKDGVPLINQLGKIIKLEGVINYLEILDLNGNGRKDLIVGSESGYISVLENLGELSDDEVPMFQDQFYLLQDKAPVKADILAVPCVAPLTYKDGKLELDMIVGTGAGYFDLFKDIGSGAPSLKWHLPNIPRILPLDFNKGSIQGPSEIGWGYVCPTLFDWNGNGLYDLIFSDINGKHQICFNEGSNTQARFSDPKSFIDFSTNKPLTTVWRVKPSVLSSKGEIFYYCLDEEARFASYIKKETGNSLILEKNSLIKTIDGKNLTFTNRFGGSRGRLKFQFFDWNQNGIPDLLFGTPSNHDFRQCFESKKVENYKRATVACAKNIGSIDEPIIAAPKYLKHRSNNQPVYFGHHSCAPEAYEWQNKIYLLVGAEDGHIYKFERDEFL